MLDKLQTAEDIPSVSHVVVFDMGGVEAGRGQIRSKVSGMILNGCIGFLLALVVVALA